MYSPFLRLTLIDCLFRGMFCPCKRLHMMPRLSTHSWSVQIPRALTHRPFESLLRGQMVTVCKT